MIRIVLVYALALAIAAFALEWLQFQYFSKTYSIEIYIAIIAIGFAALGVWMGNRLTARKSNGPFERNVAALTSLGISARELEVLEALAAGDSNKEIARTLEISPNTVKSHIGHLFEKLQVNGRVRAIEEARVHRLIR
ncbi:LuxR C-terminal-related transcriptional regulator [Parasphingorhabdus sp.]